LPSTSTKAVLSPEELLEPEKKWQKSKTYSNSPLEKSLIDSLSILALQNMLPNSALSMERRILSKFGMLEQVSSTEL
jgi:hypothetical protein